MRTAAQTFARRVFACDVENRVVSSLVEREKWFALPRSLPVCIACANAIEYSIRSQHLELRPCPHTA